MQPGMKNGQCFLPLAREKASVTSVAIKCKSNVLSDLTGSVYVFLCW